jgi:trigger factor
MEVQLEQPTAVQKILKVKIPKETVDKELMSEFQKIKKKASLKGFRKGKIPLHLVKKLYGDSAKYEVVNKLINDSLTKAVTDEKIVYIGEPSVKEISDIDEGKDFSYTAEFDCIEEFELKDYKGIEIEVEKLEVTEDMLNDSIQSILKRFTYFEDIEDDNTPVEEGFQVVAEVEAFIDGEKNEKFSKEELVITIGENTFLPDFDNYFIGLTKNDETEVTHNILVDNEEKEATFKIKVKWIKKPVVPELDEEFIKQFGEEYTSVEEFKDKVKQDLEENFKQQIRNEIIEKLMEKLREEHKFQFPEKLIEKQIDFLKKNTPQLPSEKEEDYNERIREIAVKQIQNSIILEKIEQKENIKVLKEDLDKELEKMSKAFNMDINTIRDIYLKNENLFKNMHDKVLTEKTFDFLIENINVKYTEPTEETEEKEEENSKED